MAASGWCVLSDVFLSCFAISLGSYDTEHTDRAKIPARERVHLLYYHSLLSTHERLENDVLDQSVCLCIISRTIF